MASTPVAHPHAIAKDTHDRLEALLAKAGWQAATRNLLPGDFSARSYIRLRRDQDTALVMRMPKWEELSAFIHMQEVLRQAGLRVPAILAADMQHGLALIEDLGEQGFDRLLESGNAPEPLYRLAVDVLIHLHRHRKNPDPVALGLPLFDAERFAAQVALFLDVFGLHVLGKAFGSEARLAFAEAWRDVLRHSATLPTSLLLRDYHPANIMYLPQEAGHAKAALIDFQDGGVGPTAYDLVSLLEDARRDVPEALAQAMLEYYLQAVGVPDHKAFMNGYAVLGAQRHMRVLGILARRWAEKGVDVSDFWQRSWRLLLDHSDEPLLAPVFAWLDQHIPAEARSRWRP